MSATQKKVITTVGLVLLTMYAVNRLPAVKAIVG